MRQETITDLMSLVVRMLIDGQGEGVIVEKAVRFMGCSPAFALGITKAFSGAYHDTTYDPSHDSISAEMFDAAVVWDMRRWLKSVRGDVREVDDLSTFWEWLTDRRGKQYKRAATLLDKTFQKLHPDARQALWGGASPFVLNLMQGFKDLKEFAEVRQ